MSPLPQLGRGRSADLVNGAQRCQGVDRSTNAAGRSRASLGLGRRWPFVSGEANLRSVLFDEVGYDS
jgi:hypothetical protein